MASTTYVSQQAEIVAAMKTYLANPDNWSNGVVLLTDTNPGSVLFTLLSAVSVAVDTLGLSIFMARNAAYIASATGTDLDANVADFGLTRNAAVAASGTFTFTKNTPAAATILIPAGTSVSTIPTSTSEAIIFATDMNATLAIGETSVQSVATAQVAGAGSNIAAGTQLLISSMVPGVDGVTLAASITNGADEESDAALRARGLAAFVALAHGTAESYRQAVMSVAGVADAIVSAQGRGPGTVDIYILGPDSSIPSEALQEQAQAVIDLEKVATDDVLVLLPTQRVIAATLTVHLLPDYDPTETGDAVEEAVAAYIESVGIGANTTEGYIYASQLVAAAIGLDGVLNATTTFVDTAIDPSEAPVAGVVTINVV